MVRMTFLGYLVFSLMIARSFAGLAWGRCPDTPNIPDFNTTKYSGKWYNLQNFPVTFQNGLSCVTATYGYINDTAVTVTNYGINLSNKKETSIQGVARVSDTRYPNRLKVTFPISVNLFGSDVTLFSNTGNYDVWSTDYTKYSLVYSCTNFVFFRYEVAWILAREKQLDGNTLNNLYSILTNAKISVSQFKSDPQSCSN